MSVNIKTLTGLLEIAGNGVAHWTGTREQYELDKDQIPNGTYVDITDDYTVITSDQAKDIKFNNTDTPLEATNVQAAIEECFQSVSDGKSLVASAITDKGVETSMDATFATMAENIRQISGGGGDDKFEYQTLTEYTVFRGYPNTDNSPKWTSDGSSAWIFDLGELKTRNIAWFEVRVKSGTNPIRRRIMFSNTFPYAGLTIPNTNVAINGTDTAAWNYLGFAFNRSINVRYLCVYGYSNTLVTPEFEVNLVYRK